MRKFAILILTSWVAFNGVAQGDISFSTDVTSGCAPLEVNLSNTSSNEAAANFEWNLGDGATESGTEVNYTFTAGGDYLISMTAYDANWSYLGVSEITINVEGLGEIIVSSTEPCSGESVSFLAPSGGTGYSWDFGDGSTATGEEVSHSYEGTGTYMVSLTGTFGNCGSQTNTVEVVVGTGTTPVPDFQKSTATACPGDAISFSTLTESSSYLWDFGDGTTSDEQNPSHTFQDLGDYTVTLTVVNACGLEGSVEDQVSIGASSNWPDNLGFGVSSSIACPNQPLIFTADDGNYTYAFDFGDDHTLEESDDRSVSHAYTAEGVYDVSVTYFNQCAADTTVIITVNISTENSFPTELSLEVDKSELCPGASANFTTTEGYEWYVWDFGDGSATDSTTANTSSHAFVEGSYEPSVKIYSSCGGDSTLVIAVEVTPNAELITETLSLNHAEASCPNSPVDFFASDGYSAYQWEFGDGTDAVESDDNFISHEFAANGEYEVAVTITNFCGDTQTVTSTLSVNDNIDLPESIELAASVSKTCPNEDIELFVDGGYAGYVWSLNGTRLDSTSESTYSTRVSELGTAVFSVKIYNSCGKSATLEKSVEVSNDLPFEDKITLNTPAEVCPNETVTFQATKGFNSYLWDFGDGTSTTGVSTAQHIYTALGEYDVNLTVTNACGTDSTVAVVARITANSPIAESTTLLKDKNSTCPGELVTFSTSKGFIKYVWNLGDGSPTIETSTNSITYGFDEVGEFSVSVEVFNTCGNSRLLALPHETSTVSSFSGFLNISATPESVCPGENITLSGPSNYKNYEWNFGDGSEESDSIAAQVNHSYKSEGVYEISLTFQNACGADTTISKAIEISANAPFDPSIRFDVDKEMACPGEFFHFSAPLGYQDYQWDFSVQSDSSLYNRKSEVDFSFPDLGTYDVTVFFKNSCGNDTSLTRQVIVGNDVSVLEGAFVDIKDQVCPGERVEFTAKAGFAKYFWDFGDGSKDTTSTSVLSHIYDVAGGYQFALTIQNSCGADSLLTSFVSIDEAITQENLLIEVPGSVCPGEAIFMNGPSGFTTYEWEVNGKTYNTDDAFLSVTLDSLAAYDVALTLYNACGTDTTIFSSVEVGNSESDFDDFLKIQADYQEVCPGDEVTVSVEGTSLKSFLWSLNGGDGFKASRSIKVSFEETGEQEIEVNASNYCGADTTLTLLVLVTTEGTAQKVITLSSSTEAACPGETIGFTASSGFGSYEWKFGDGSIKNSTSPTVHHTYKLAGNYVVWVTVTDKCGNEFGKSVIMDVSGDKDFSEGVNLSLSKNKVCPGEAVNFSVEGLGSDYTYEWSVVDSTYTSHASVSSWVFDEPGNYDVEVLVTDLCGNELTLAKEVLVRSDAKIPFVLFGIDGDEERAGCPGDIITFFFQGEYNNTWDFGDGTQLSATEVGVDQNGAKQTVIQYKYDAEGTYDVSLYLENKCGARDTLFTRVVVGGNVAGETSLSFSVPDAEVGYARCAPVTFKVSGGSSFVWDFGDGTKRTSTNPSVTHVFAEAGVYEIKVAITNGCGITTTQNSNINIANQALPLVELVEQTKPQCAEDASGALEVQGSGFGPFSYTWEVADENETNTLTNVISGNYAVTVTDRFGCSYSATFTLEAEGSLVLDETITDAACGESNGSISLGLERPEDFTFLWNDGATEAERTSLAFGAYEVTITENLTGCLFTNQYQISEATALEVSGVVTNASCYGGTDGSIDVEIPGLTEGVTFFWSSGQTTQNVSNLGAGNYKVTITDENGCRLIRSFDIIEPDSLVLKLTKTDASCTGDPGSASLKVSGGSGAYTYLWSDGSENKTNEALAVGNHSVLVTDSGGCSKSLEFEISEASGFEISAGIQHNTCFGSEQGAISLSILGGVAPFTYYWEGGEIVKERSDLANGTYGVVVTDQLGCSVAGEFTIESVDDIPPTVMANDFFISLDSNGEALILPDYLNNGSFDNCEIAQMALDISTFGCEDIGVHTVTLTVEDMSGNIGSASAKVEIVDQVAPEVITQDLVINLDENGNAQVEADAVNSGSSDACGIAEVSLDVDAFDCSSVGVNEVHLTVTDVNGNSASAPAKITIVDDISPVVAVKDITVELNEGEVEIQVSDVDDGTSDACGFNLSLDLMRFDCEDLGTTREVTLTAVDQNGNAQSGVARVSVVDNAAGTGCSLLGVVEHSLRVYPNPAVSSFTVESAATEPVRLYNMSGAFLMEGMTNEELNLSLLPSGVYIIELRGVRLKLKKL